MPDLTPLHAVQAELEAFASGRLPAGHYARQGGVGMFLQRAGTGETTTTPATFHTGAFDPLWAAFRAAGYDPDARIDHGAWLKGPGASGTGPDRIAAMARTDLARLLVAFRRLERFCAGLWVGLVEDGSLLTVARRVLDLTRHEG